MHVCIYVYGMVPLILYIMRKIIAVEISVGSSIVQSAFKHFIYVLLNQNQWPNNNINRWVEFWGDWMGFTIIILLIYILKFSGKYFSMTRVDKTSDTKNFQIPIFKKSEMSNNDVVDYGYVTSIFRWTVPAYDIH